VFSGDGVTALRHMARSLISSPRILVTDPLKTSETMACALALFLARPLSSPIISALAERRRRRAQALPWLAGLAGG
jgi:hypothetical protein